MAIDAYLQIGGIKGESTDDKHRDWIEISEVSWNVHQTRSSSASTAGGLTIGRAELSEITFKKLADMASPIGWVKNRASGGLRYFPIGTRNLILAMTFRLTKPTNFT